MKNRNKVLEKVAKLMRLAKSTNPHEAANALSKAQALMNKYQIDESEVEIADVEHVAAKLLDRVNPLKHEAIIINAIAQAFRVKPIVGFGLNNRCKVKAQVIFIGLAPQSELAAYCFDFIYRKLKNARLEFTKSLSNNCKKSTKTQRSDAFCLGWAIQINQSIERFALSDKHESLIDLYIENNFGQTKNRLGKQRKGKVRRDDFAKGGLAARGVNIHSPVNGETQKQISCN